QAELRARVALREEVLLGVVQHVPALAAREAERADGEGVLGQLGVGDALVVVAVELDEELDLLALGRAEAVSGGAEQARQGRVGVVLDAAAEQYANQARVPSLAL